MLLLQKQKHQKNIGVLKNDDTKAQFINMMHFAYHRKNWETDNINEKMLKFNDAIHYAIEETIPSKERIKRRPWISDATLQMIEQRLQFRIKLDYIKEQEMNKAIKRQVKIDGQIWLDKLLEDGNWSAMKAFKKY